MASSSYLARIIFKEHTTAGDEPVDFTGTYNLLLNAKTVPSPVSAPNTIETTTLEDPVQTFVMGIKTADAKEVTGNLEKKYLQAINALEGKQIDIFHLYGSGGVGEVAKYAYVGQATATPNDVGGVDEVLEMTVTIIPNTAAVECTDTFAIADNKDGTFNVTKVAGTEF